jgi:hypothetical protein
MKPAVYPMERMMCAGVIALATFVASIAAGGVVDETVGASEAPRAKAPVSTNEVAVIGEGVISLLMFDTELPR